MIDFEITPSGDLKLKENPNIPNGIRLGFYVSETKAACLSFYCDFEEVATGTCIAFDVTDKPQDTFYVEALDGISCKIQNANMRLMTSKGDIISNSEFGSLLEKTKHRNLHDPIVLADVETKATEALSELFTDLEVKVEPVVQQSNGYEQIALIKIYSKKELVEEYELR